MLIGEKIRSLRQKKNLKQLDLARALQVSPQAVSKWEKDANAPDILQLVKLAALFDVTTDHLLGRQDHKQGLFEATVFYSSLRDFAKRSTRMDARELADTVNALFYSLTEAALSQGAVPVKYVGDGFLCFFSGASHADRAVQAALKARRLTQNRDLVIALNSGEIYFGAIGHRDFSSRDILGETVNLVFLVTPWMAKNFGGGIGLTDSTAAFLKKKYSLGRAARALVPLIRRPVMLHELKA